jgi:hypothetical protein
MWGYDLLQKRPFRVLTAWQAEEWSEIGSTQRRKQIITPCLHENARSDKYSTTPCGQVLRSSHGSVAAREVSSCINNINQRLW